MNVFMSISPRKKGGGPNTFAGLMGDWLKGNGYRLVTSPEKADTAILFANRAKYEEIEKAKKNGVFVLHRLDEHFEENETGFRKEKHEQLIQLNKLADLTIFQSQFVFENVYPHIKPKNYSIIHNGGDPESFFPASSIGKYIGHVTWSVHEKKRLDLLYKFIKEHPDEHFLLIGNHRDSAFEFDMPNVLIKGKTSRRKLGRYYRMMKLMYFPSENDPCSNSVVEAILSGVPVCYHPVGGNVELVRECGEPLDNVDILINNLEKYRHRCSDRKDLYFDAVAEKYIDLVKKRDPGFSV